MRLKDKAVLVTGAGRGIGRAIAIAAARDGAAVTIADRDAEGAASTVTQILKAGGQAVAIVADVGAPIDCERAAKFALDAFGRIDGLVNNAGIGFYQPFLETSLDDWERVMRVNLTSAFLLGQQAARTMARQGSGRIVNIGSISGQRGGEGRSAYGTSKAGLMHLTRVMAVELAPAGIAVNAISPGPIETDLSQHAAALRRAYLDRIPMGRYGEPEAVAAATIFLLSDECQFVTGHVLDVDGGFMAAGLMLSAHI